MWKNTIKMCRRHHHDVTVSSREGTSTSRQEAAAAELQIAFAEAYFCVIENLIN